MRNCGAENQALDQLGGVLSRLYDVGGNDRSQHEADIDFADDDMPDGVSSQVLPILQDLRAQIATICRITGAVNGCGTASRLR